MGKERVKKYSHQVVISLKQGNKPNTVSPSFSGIQDTSIPGSLREIEAQWPTCSFLLRGSAFVQISDFLNIFTNELHSDITYSTSTRHFCVSQTDSGAQFHLWQNCKHISPFLSCLTFTFPKHVMAAAQSKTT